MDFEPQRSAGNSPRSGARRRYTSDERAERVSDRDDQHVAWDIDGTAAQRQRAVISGRAGLLGAGVTLVSFHHPVSWLIGLALLGGYAATAKR